jgi:hypothetical protein
MTKNNRVRLLLEDGGEGGIRTHGTRKGTTVFETVPIDHSGTSPQSAPDTGQAGIRVEARAIAEGAGPAKPDFAAICAGCRDTTPLHVGPRPPILQLDDAVSST